MVLRLIAALRAHIWHSSYRLSARYAQTTHPAAIVGEKKSPAMSTTGTTRRCEDQSDIDDCAITQKLCE